MFATIHTTPIQRDAGSAILVARCDHVAVTPDADAARFVYPLAELESRRAADHASVNQARSRRRPSLALLSSSRIASKKSSSKLARLWELMRILDATCAGINVDDI